jgi:hypothetical protein
MKRKSIVLVVVILIKTFTAFTVNAQDQPKSQLFTVHEDLVIPSMADKYEAAAKSLAAAMAKHNISSFSYRAANRDDFTYLYFIPLNNLAGMDMVMDGFKQLEKAMGKEAFDATMKQFDGCFYTHRDYMVRFHPELSYLPDFPADMNFRHWDFYYLYPDKEDQAMALAKEWKALFEKKKITSGFRVSLGELGTEPMLVVVQAGKNALDYYTKSAEIDKALGEEGNALMKKTMIVVRKFDHKNGAMRPELSYTPTVTSKN